MPRINILADFQSALKSFNMFNISLHEFRRKTLQIKELYDDNNKDIYFSALDEFLSTLSHREMYLIIALISDEQTLVNLTKNAEYKPSALLKKLV